MAVSCSFAGAGRYLTPGLAMVCLRQKSVKIAIRDETAIDSLVNKARMRRLTGWHMRARLVSAQAALARNACVALAAITTSPTQIWATDLLPEMTKAGSFSTT